MGVLVSGRNTGRVDKTWNLLLVVGDRDVFFGTVDSVASVYNRFIEK